VADLAAAWRGDRDAERASDAVPIAPQRVLGEIEAAIGRDDMLICDASLASGWGGVYLEQRHSGRRVLCPRGQAGLGYALPAAIGVATARPEPARWCWPGTARWGMRRVNSPPWQNWACRSP
jgi:acetolactate synthase-1/2/3 large subunit